MSIASGWSQFAVGSQDVLLFWQIWRVRYESWFSGNDLSLFRFCWLYWIVQVGSDRKQDGRKVTCSEGSKVGFRFRAAAARTQPPYTRPSKLRCDLKMLVFVSQFVFFKVTMMRHLSMSLPNKHALLNLGSKICRTGHLCSTAVLHYNTVCHTFQLWVKKKSQQRPAILDNTLSHIAIFILMPDAHSGGGRSRHAGCRTCCMWIKHRPRYHRASLMSVWNNLSSKKWLSLSHRCSQKQVVPLRDSSAILILTKAELQADSC